MGLGYAFIGVPVPLYIVLRGCLATPEREVCKGLRVRFSFPPNLKRWPDGADKQHWQDAAR